jgi:uncharacterized protein
MDLFDAVDTGDWQVVRETLLKRPQDLNDDDVQGWTPLMNAAYNGDAKIVDVLVSRGAQVYATDHRGYTAMHIAAGRHDDEKVMKELLSTGASVNIVNKKGQTPLHLAEGLRITKVLLEHRADVGIKDNSGKTAVDIADYYKRDFIQQWQHSAWEHTVMEFCKGLHPRLGAQSSIRRCWTSDLSERYLIWKIGLLLKPFV